MKDKKLWKQLARDGIILAVAGALSALIWPVSCLLGNNSDWIYKLSEQLPWVFFLLSGLTGYYFIKAADEDTRRKDETASKTASEYETEGALLDDAVTEKVQRILGEAKNNTSTSLPLKEDSISDLDLAYNETLHALKALITIKMLSPWEKYVARNENGIIKFFGNLTRFGRCTYSIYLYDDFKIAPSTENGFELALNVSDEFINELIDDAVAKIAEEIVVIGRSIEAKVRPSSSNTLNVPSDQPLEVTKVVLFAPIPELAGTDSFTTTL